VESIGGHWHQQIQSAHFESRRAATLNAASELCRRCHHRVFLAFGEEKSANGCSRNGLDDSPDVPFSFFFPLFFRERATMARGEPPDRSAVAIDCRRGSCREFDCVFRTYISLERSRVADEVCELDITTDSRPIRTATLLNGDNSIIAPRKVARILDD